MRDVRGYSFATTIVQGAEAPRLVEQGTNLPMESGRAIELQVCGGVQVDWHESADVVADRFVERATIYNGTPFIAPNDFRTEQLVERPPSIASFGGVIGNDYFIL